LVTNNTGQESTIVHRTVAKWSNFCFDNLEASINQSAPFAAGCLGIILNFLPSQNAPFWASFLGLLTYELIRKKVHVSILNYL
jgi:hypothetical protein